MHEEGYHIEDEYYRLWTSIMGMEEHLDEFEEHGPKAWNHVRLTVFTLQYDYYTLHLSR